MTLKQDLDQCWGFKVDVLFEWLTAAYIQENRPNPDRDIPSKRAAASGLCLARSLFSMGIFVDRMGQDRTGGIKFEKMSPHKEWRIEQDGTCYQIQPEGPANRHTKLWGPMP